MFAKTLKIVLPSTMGIVFVLVELDRAAGGTKAPPPAIVDPGPVGGPPSDAIILFDGKDLSKWRAARGGDAGWAVEDGVLTVAPGKGDIITREKYGDVQLHIEWAVPESPPGRRGESRGNSGLKLHTRYEIQILDSYRNQKTSKGQAAAIYAQTPPLVNACRPPGEWQTYDIIFRTPRFDGSGNRSQLGRFTVFHNGVLVHDNVEILGPTNSRRPATPESRKPLLLQDHGSRVRYRNIWLRELEPRREEDD